MNAQTERFEIAVQLDLAQDTLHLLRRLRVVVDPEEPEALGAVAIHQPTNGRRRALVDHVQW